MAITIGVFDSGVGGLSVARATGRAFPEATVHYVNDRAHVPYGDKDPKLLMTYVTPIFKDLEARKCDVIVIACNTVTTLLLDQLKTLVSVPLIGVEPMVLEAATATKTGKIAVCATPGTLASTRYKYLKQTYATSNDISVIEPDCSTWAYMIEHDDINTAAIVKTVEDVVADGADVIVLGCTHYHWIEETIRNASAGRAQIIQPEPKIIQRLATMFGMTITPEQQS